MQNKFDDDLKVPISTSCVVLGMHTYSNTYIPTYDLCLRYYYNAPAFIIHDQNQ